MPDTTTLTGTHLIDGQWIASPGDTFAPTNPATGDALSPSFHEAAQSEVDRAFDAARQAFEQTRALPPSAWASLLDAIADELEALGDPLLERAAEESGLPAATRLTGERGRTTGQLRLFATLVREGSWVDAVIDTADADRKPLPKPDVRRMRRSVGPVVVFDASNFPLAFGACGGDTASALAAGNPVIVKSHPAHPGTGELCAAAVLKALEKTGLPTGLFALLQGRGVEVGAALVEHTDAAAIAFTGSKRGGRALFDVAARRDVPIPFYGELGSVNPLIVLPGALAERGEAIATGLAGSVTLGAGQFCTKPGLVFVPTGSEGDAFVATLETALAAADAFTLLNPGIREGFGECASRMAGASGVTTRVTGGAMSPAVANAYLFEVDCAHWAADDSLSEEVFGPAALVIRCDGVDEICEAIEHLDGNLTGSIHVAPSDDAAAERVAAALEHRVGRLIYNGFPTGVEVCHAMVHGGPYPATTAPLTTSVGTAAIERFARPIAFQDAPQAMLPDALKDDNPLGILRKINGNVSRDAVG